MLGYFFYLTTELTLSPMKLLNNAAAVSTGFLRPPNRAVLSAAAADLVGSFQEIKVCIHFISFIKFCAGNAFALHNNGFNFIHYNTV